MRHTICIRQTLWDLCPNLKRWPDGDIPVCRDVRFDLVAVADPEGVGLLFYQSNGKIVSSCFWTVDIPSQELGRVILNGLPEDLVPWRALKIGFKEL